MLDSDKALRLLRFGEMLRGLRECPPAPRFWFRGLRECPWFGSPESRFCFTFWLLACPLAPRRRFHPRPRTCLDWESMVRVVSQNVVRALGQALDRDSRYSALWFARALILHPARTKTYRARSHGHVGSRALCLVGSSRAAGIPGIPGIPGILGCDIFCFFWWAPPDCEDPWDPFLGALDGTRPWMRAKGIERLIFFKSPLNVHLRSHIAAETVLRFLRCVPDQLNNVQDLARRAKATYLSELCDALGYDGPPELLSMYCCLFSNLQVPDRREHLHGLASGCPAGSERAGPWGSSGPWGRGEASGRRGPFPPRAHPRLAYLRDEGVAPAPAILLRLAAGMPE